MAAPDWQTDLARREADASGLTVIGDLGAIVHRDLVDIAGDIGAGEIAFRYIGRELGNAYADGADSPELRQRAIRKLSLLRDDIDKLILELRAGL